MTESVNNRTAGPAEEPVDRMTDAATRTTERADRTNLNVGDLPAAPAR